MARSPQAKKLVSELANAKLGDIKRLAGSIKKDHDLATEPWATGEFHPRLLAVLILDNKLLTQSAIDALASDIMEHDEKELANGR